MRDLVHNRNEPLSDELLFPYPQPKSLALILSPKERATVLRVEKDTPAAKAGFEPGDVIKKLAGQPLLSIADMQWVLHNASPRGATLAAKVERAGKPIQIELKLSEGWRQRDDIS